MIDPSQKESTLRLIHWALEEDLGERGDITSNALGTSEAEAQAHIVAKQDGVFCGAPIIEWVFAEVDPSIKNTPLVAEGALVHRGQRVVTIQGSARSILTAERTALNMAGRFSGIATFTHRFVNAVQGTSAKILDTRKTTAGWRFWEKYAVRCGGGENHRFGLYDMFLIKENHIASAGSISQAVDHCRDYMTTHHFECPIEVETSTIDQVQEALQLEVDRIMLDNMTLDAMRECVALVAQRIPLEASGNVSLNTVRGIAETGVNFVSVGALTHSAATFDLSLLVL